MVGPAPAAPVPPPPPPSPATITIDDFKKVVLKVGKVTEASAHANANKLLVLKVDLGGGEVRQVVSGIKQWYAPEQLVGKSVILVANLAPAMLRGVESQGMVLATTSGDQVILLSPEKDAAPGSKVS
ncbi:MAG TPA: methionine--tRNA ligase subunit beta [Planctomycetota bacterium]|jgi:methionyl-tRNA synthetase|nr:methionine--tRNA ligase subunit beta [Planctomycetota bacterium]